MMGVFHMKKNSRPDYDRMSQRRTLEQRAHEAALAAVPDGHLAPDEVAGHRHRILSATNAMLKRNERKAHAERVQLARRNERFGGRRG